MNYIAKQVPPEWQESPLYWGDFPENIAVFGNRDYKSHIPETVQTVLDLAENGDLGWALENREPDETTRDIIMEYLPKESGEYTPAELDELQSIFLADTPWDEKSVCRILTIQTGQEWEWGTIRGSCQRDWQHVIYPANDWDSTTLRIFKTEYFNTGSEWDIVDESGESWGSEYTHAWDTLDTITELSEILDCAPEEITLYRFSGWVRTPKYEEVNV